MVLRPGQSAWPGSGSGWSSQGCSSPSSNLDSAAAVDMTGGEVTLLQPLSLPLTTSPRGLQVEGLFSNESMDAMAVAAGGLDRRSPLLPLRGHEYDAMFSKESMDAMAVAAGGLDRPSSHLPLRGNEYEAMFSKESIDAMAVAVGGLDRRSPLLPLRGHEYDAMFSKESMDAMAVAAGGLDRPSPQLPLRGHEYEAMFSKESLDAMAVAAGVLDRPGLPPPLRGVVVYDGMFSKESLDAMAAMAVAEPLGVPHAYLPTPSDMHMPATLQPPTGMCVQQQAGGSGGVGGQSQGCRDEGLATLYDTFTKVSLDPSDQEMLMFAKDSLDVDTAMSGLEELGPGEAAGQGQGQVPQSNSGSGSGRGRRGTGVLQWASKLWPS